MIVQRISKQTSPCLLCDAAKCWKLRSFGLLCVLSQPAVGTLAKVSCVDCNIRDQIISIFLLLQSTKSHLCSRDVLLGVFKVCKLSPSQPPTVSRKCVVRPHQGVFLPSDAFPLVCVCVGEAFNLASLSPKKAMQTGTNLVLSFLSGVALFASCLSEG